MGSNKPGDLRICVHNIHVLLILLRKRKKSLPDLKQMTDVRKVQLEEMSPMSEQMVRQLEVVPFHPNDLLYKPFKHSPAPFFDFDLVTLLDGDEEIRVVFDCGLETPPILLEEVIIHASAAPGNIGILYRGAVHIDEPADLRLAGFEARKAQLFIDAVCHANRFKLLILGRRFRGSEGGKLDCLRSSRSEGCAVRSGFVPVLVRFP